ncbi:MAG: DUF6788 family protein, partial [Acidimicrobiales bacterium]
AQAMASSCVPAGDAPGSALRGQAFMATAPGDELAEGLGRIDGVLPGSVVVRRMRCGRTECACRGDPPANRRLGGPAMAA